MPKGKSGVETFFDELPSDDKSVADIFEKEGQQQVPEEGKEGGQAGDGSHEEPRKNRRHRRLEQQLQQEREARIAAEARAAGIAEAGRTAVVVGDVPEKWLRLYGDTPESRQAWSVQKELFDDFGKGVREETIKEIEAKRKKEEEEAARHEAFITSSLEDLEDEYNVDLTSDSPAARKARREMLALVEELSPKDEHGNVVAFADFDAVWKQYSSKKPEEKPDNSRNKELAGRAMTRSGDAATVEKQHTPGFFGWKRDYNVG